MNNNISSSKEDMANNNSTTETTYANIQAEVNQTQPPTTQQNYINTYQTQSSPINQGANTPEIKQSTQTQNIQPNHSKISPPSEIKKRKPIVAILLLFIISGLCIYIYYISITYQKEIERMVEECTPVSTNGEIKDLDLNSTIVQDLYSKVKTNIYEDIANFELNDKMKLYLAYRQLPTSKIYSSNCNYFNDAKTPSYTCKERVGFTPTAFKQEDLEIEVKKLFGETTEIPNDDIQLGIACIGGYQYIAERGEYVEGECKQLSATTFKVDKELIKATSTESTIILYEKVKYYGTEGKNPPDSLKSGTYKYTFKLDMNYNYVYINKEYEIQ